MSQLESVYQVGQVQRKYSSKDIMSLVSFNIDLKRVNFSGEIIYVGDRVKTLKFSSSQELVHCKQDAGH